MSNIQEVKVLIGRMDRENSPETVSLYDYIEAHNIRSVGNDESDANYLSNLEGNVKITLNLPLGQNRCVGSASFENVSKAYLVRYNSAGYHQIVEFNYDTNVEMVIFEDITDTNSSTSILNIEPDTYFSDIRLVHGRFLILNDGVNPIMCINIESFKETRGTVDRVIEDFDLTKMPSLIPPTMEYLSDSSRTTNNLRGSLFQFRTQFGYADYRDSVWSTVSKRVVPINEAGDGYGQNVQLYNVLRVAVDIGTDRVDVIRIATREGNGNWLIVKEVGRDYITNLPDTDINVPNITEAYNPATNEYIFLFYNDGLYPLADPVEVELGYDHSPEKAETVEVINGNILAIGGITEGKDRPVIEEFFLDVSTYDPNILTDIEGGGDFDTDGYTRSSRNSGIDDKAYRYTLRFKGTPKAGDKILIETKAWNSSLTKDSYSYTVTNFDEQGGLARVYQSLAGILPNSSYNSTSVSFQTAWVGAGASPDDIKTFSVTRLDIGTAVTKSISSLKTNSSYQVAIAYFDKHGKYFPIVTDDRFIAKTPAYPDSEGLLPEINWSIQDEAPEGAVGYQLLLTENQTHLSSIWLTAKYEPALSTTGYLAFNVKSLERFFQNEKESRVNYSFTKGDKVTLMYVTNGSNNDPITWFRYPFIDLDIVDFTVEPSPSDPDQVLYTLKVRNTSFIDTSSSEFTTGEILMELYTPKRRSTDIDNLVFFEIGEYYPIVNGQHSVTSGTIREGDWYYKGRLYESTVNAGTAITYLVEDPNFSDNYESKYWSAGRARIYNDEQGRVEKQAFIRYSDEYVYGTRYNGISRFYTERIYGEQGGQTTSKYGWIRKLETRDNALVCIQEFKVGVIPVFTSIFFDNSSTEVVATSDRIFGSIQYRTGNYGCGTAKESISVTRDGLIYFFDDNNCLPLRDSLSGLDVIDVNMTSYFIKYAKEAKDKGAKFIGYYDNYNKEWNLTIEEVSGRLISIIFEEGLIQYKDTYVPPLADVVLGTPNNGTANLTGNLLTYTPNEDYIGTDQVSLTYPSPDGNVVKYVDFNVVMGDGTPNDFSFPSKSNQQLSTLVASNSIIVDGVNMPVAISIVDGEYRVNGGAWTSTSGQVVNGDEIQVRVLSSSSHDTPVTTTLTIGGVSGTFTVTTIPEEVTPEQFLQIQGFVTNDGDNTYGIRVEITHALNVNYSIKGRISFVKFGSSQLTPAFTLSIPAGSTSAYKPSLLIQPDNILSGDLILSSSQPFSDGDIVTTADDVTRVVKIYPQMLIEY